jgi:hypothetical protein
MIIMVNARSTVVQHAFYAPALDEDDALGDKFPPREINNSAERAAVVFIILCARACRSTVLIAVFRQKRIYQHIKRGDVEFSRTCRINS